MAHADTQIITAAAARLVSMTTVADANVYVEHIWDFTDAVLPAIDLVVESSTPFEPGEEESSGTLGSVIGRRLIIAFNHYAKMDTGVGAQLRAQAGEVVKKLISSSSDTDLGGLVSEVDLLGYDLTLAWEELPVGQLIQRVAFTYYVAVNDPDTILW